jgi:thiol-disulfide isomerase/thioredoxin
MLKKIKSLFRSKSLLCQLCVAFLVFGTLHFLIKVNHLEGLANKNTLRYFYKEGCPHCVTFSPEWDKFVQKGGSKYETEKVEEANINSEHAQYIKGFPTVMLFKADSTTKEFTGDRTAEALETFMNSEAK